MDLFKFNPIDKPPQKPEDDWPSEEERRELWSHVYTGHIKRFPNGYKKVIDAVPPLFLQPIIYSSLPNVAAFNAVLEFHSIGPGDGGNDALVEAFLKSSGRGSLRSDLQEAAKRGRFSRDLSNFTFGVLRTSAGSELTTLEHWLLIERMTVSLKRYLPASRHLRITCSLMTSMLQNSIPSTPRPCID